MTRVLIAGSGIAAVECILALRALAGDRVEVEILAPSAELVRRPESVRTPFGGAPAPRIDVGRLGVPIRRGALAAVEAQTRHVVTRDGERLPYEVLVVATGARSHGTVPGAVTFRGPLSAGAVEGVLARAAADPTLRIAFTAPHGARWLLPLYELALQTAAGLPSNDVVVATPEPAPLAVLGRAAGAAVEAALDRAGVDLVTGAAPAAALDGALQLRDGRLIPAGAFVTLPALEGPAIPGLPCDAGGFLLVDEHGLMRGCRDVLAAGDATAFPVKHGGIAAQQADAVAETIAARAGAIAVPEPFRPLLRAQMLTGGAPLYIAADLSELPVEADVSEEPLWSPPGKVAGRYLAPLLEA
jgi:sulfide:quinone oxidoreductase